MQSPLTVNDFCASIVSLSSSRAFDNVLDFDNRIFGHLVFLVVATCLLLIGVTIIFFIQVETISRVGRIESVVEKVQKKVGVESLV